MKATPLPSSRYDGVVVRPEGVVVLVVGEEQRGPVVLLSQQQRGGHGGEDLHRGLQRRAQSLGGGKTRGTRKPACELSM